MTLDELYEWMIAHGAIAARVGDVALTLGEQPFAPRGESTPFETYLREKGEKQRVYATPEEDPDLYGREPPGLDE